MYSSKWVVVELGDDGVASRYYPACAVNLWPTDWGYSLACSRNYY